MSRSNYEEPAYEPISLRDHFAIAAMNRCIGEHCKSYEQVAELAYKYADAMLAARDINSCPLEKNDG